MKRFRPYCAGYIVLYVLTFLCFCDVVYTVYRQVRGINDAMSTFYMFTFFVFALSLCYIWMYGRTQVVVTEKQLRMAFPANVLPKEGERRASFIFRQGQADIRFIDKTLNLDTLTRYGYVEDLGYKRIDVSQAGPDNKLFPVHEVAFITSENKRYHLNAAVYSPKQRREMFALIQERSGVAPEGKLAEELAA